MSIRTILFILALTISIELVHLQKLKRRAEFKASDFVFNLANSTPAAIGLAGTGRSMNVDSLPSLSGEGIAMVLFKIDPCGINLPHVHPRASELFYVLKGTFETAFIEENSGRTVINTLTAGQATFFPQGLIHEETNVGCEEAIFISGFGHEDPGVLTISNRLFTLPEEALTSTFDEKPNLIKKLAEGLPQNPAIGSNECLKRCKLNKKPSK